MFDEIDALRAALRVAQEATRTATESYERLRGLRNSEVISDGIIQGKYRRRAVTAEDDADRLNAHIRSMGTRRHTDGCHAAVGCVCGTEAVLAAHAAAVAARTTGDAT